MTILKAITINLLSDPEHWDQRKQLLAEGLGRLHADLIAAQEVNLENGTAFWLAEQLGLEHVFLTPKTGKDGLKEGLAILSRHPFERTRWLNLESQNRVAQQVMLRAADKLLSFTNVHLYWQPGNSPRRQAQVRRLLEWLNADYEGQPVVLCGDFNSYPDSKTIRLVKERYRSAFETVHGREPAWTAPTPLRRSTLVKLRTLASFWRELRPAQLFIPWEGTLDYLFTNPYVHVLSSWLVLNQPAAEDPKIYPSDHLGLAVELEV